MQTELRALSEVLPELPFLEIADRGKQGAVKPTQLRAQPDPPNLNALKRDVRSRWGIVALIDMLKESILRTGCLEIVGDLGWADRLTAEDKRGITPLIWGHVVPHGEIRLDIGRRLELPQ